MKFRIFTLGCRQNHYESELIRQQLEKSGYIYTEKDPEIIIVNSCAVTMRAEYKSRDMAKRLKKDPSVKKVYMIGCSAQNNREDYLKINVIPLNNTEKFNISNYLDGSGNTDKKTEKILEDFKTQTRAFLSVQDGCNNSCSYCVITKLRGVSVSKSKDAIHKEIENLINKRKKEIVVTGINIGLWGKDLGYGLEQLFEIFLHYKDTRFRISSLNPEHISDSIIRIFNEKNNIMPHIHISMQSGSDKVLRSHRRKYTVSDFVKITEKLKKDPYFRIGIDVIAGLPGEGNDDFEKTLRIVEKAKIDYMHIFPYSKRENTEALKYEQVPSKTIKERSNILQRYNKYIRKRSLEYNLELVHTVYVEERSAGKYGLGFTDNYIEVAVENTRKNAIIKFKGEYIKDERLYGKEINTE